MLISGTCKFIGLTPSREEGIVRIQLEDTAHAHRLVPRGAKKAKLGGLNCPVFATLEQVSGLRIGEILEVDGVLHVLESDRRGNEDSGRTYENVRIYLDKIEVVAAAKV